MELLEKAEQLRQWRKESDKLTNDYLNSVFQKIFGKIPKSKAKLNDISDKSNKNNFGNGPFGSNLLTRELTDHGVPVIYIRDISNGRYIRKSKVFVTPEKAIELSYCQVHSGDLLVTKVGDPPGISAVYPESQQTGVITQDVIRLRVERNFMDPIYVQFYLNSNKGRQKIESIIVRGTRSRFTLGSFKNLEIEVPEIQLQKEFACIVQQVERLRIQQQKCSVQIENLNSHLIQKVFNGELQC